MNRNLGLNAECNQDLAPDDRAQVFASDRFRQGIAGDASFDGKLTLSKTKPSDLSAQFALRKTQRVLQSAENSYNLRRNE